MIRGLTVDSMSLKKNAWGGCARLPRIALVGGLAEAYASRLPRRLAPVIVPARRDALAGAIDLARQAAGSRRRARPAGP